MSDPSVNGHAVPADYPPIIHENAVLTLAQARKLLGLAEHTLPREVRLGRLRCSKRAGRHWILGSWLLQWVESGEVTRKQRRAAAARTA